MPVLVHSRHDDEIADLIERVRSAKEPDVGLVIPSDSRALQTPLNARLLSQFSKQSGRRVAIVSDDAHIQQLVRANGFTVYASVMGYERGIEVIPARPPAIGTPAEIGSVAATALAEAPAAVTTRVATPPPPSGPRIEPRRSLPAPAPGKPGGRDRRRILYFAAAAVAIVGLVLFLTLSPSAKITITVAGTPLSVSPTILGSADPAQAASGDRIRTSVVTSTAMNTFQANPSGQKTLPATVATGTIQFSSSFPNYEGTVPTGSVFKTADQTVTFVVTQDTFVCFGPPGPPPTNCMNHGHPAQPNAIVPVQDQVPEAKGNVAASTITYWPPSEQPASCQPNLCNVTNPQPTSGGADPKQEVVASSQDLSSWNGQVQQIESTLTAQVNADMKTRAGGKTFAVDPGGGGKSINFAVSPPLPNAGDQFAATQINITASAKAAIYDPNAVRSDVIADLQAKVPQGDQLAPDKLQVQPIAVTQAADDGMMVLSVTATDFSQPVVDLEGLKSQLAGKSPSDAAGIIRKRIDHVQDVQVSESPFTLFFLPFFANRIEIDETFVAQAQASS